MILWFYSSIQDWGSAQILTISRLVRSINAAKGLQSFNIAIISQDMELIQILSKDFSTQLLYCQDLSSAANSKYYRITTITLPHGRLILPYGG